jgi:hypothetical protein
MKPKEHSEKRNLAGNHREFHGDVTRHGQPKHMRHSRNFKTPKIKNTRRHRNK